MDIQQFQKNRAAFPHAELLRHRGKWVAFSSDGRRIVASHEDLGVLDALVVAVGEDPEQVGYEQVPDEDTYLGAAEMW